MMKSLITTKISWFFTNDEWWYHCCKLFDTKTFWNMKQPNMVISIYNTFHEVDIFENQNDRK
jgi:hypothetical protein